MTGLIDKAIPTDEEAISYLKSNNNGNLTITAHFAKKLYPDYIKGNKHFICPTSGCNAPITCRSIRHDSLNSPTFQNQKTSENLHIEGCTRGPDYKGDISINGEANEDKFKHIKNDELVSDLILGRGFVEDQKVGTQNENSQLKKESKYNSTKISKNESLKNKKVRNHLGTLQSHVELYEYNENERIFSQTSKKFIPIKFMFKSISNNKLFKDIKSNKYIFIYYGKAYLNKQEDDKVRIQFKNSVRVNQERFKPSFFIELSYLENEYSEIYEEFINGDASLFNIYTTLPFIIKENNDQTYLNLSSFVKENVLFHTDEELKRNIYIS